MLKPVFYISMTYNRTCFEFTDYNCAWFVYECLMVALYLVLIWISIKDQVIYNVNIVHYHMNPLYGQWP